eukprot:scaffold10451_cov121-Isochrysis_galbana.AAC.13
MWPASTAAFHCAPNWRTIAGRSRCPMRRLGRPPGSARTMYLRSIGVALSSSRAGVCRNCEALLIAVSTRSARPV